MNTPMSLTNTPVNSIAWESQAQGYNTTAMHNHNRKFWRRPVALKNLGFQHWIGVEDFKTKKRVGNWHADSMLTDAVINFETMWLHSIQNFFDIGIFS